MALVLADGASHLVRFPSGAGFVDLQIGQPSEVILKAIPLGKAGTHARPRVGDLLTVGSDAGKIDNAPWTSRVIETDGWRVKVAYDDGEVWYELDQANLDYLEREEDGGMHWLFSKAKGRTLYVYRPLDNAREFIDWAKSQGFKKTLQPGDLHTTIAYSRAPVDWAKSSPYPSHLPIAGGKRSVEPLGDKGAVVLKFYSDELAARWQEFRELGCSWDFPSYQPHVTIAYEDQRGRDLSEVKPFSRPLVFGPERWAEVDDDWSKKVVHKGVAHVPIETAKELNKLCRCVDDDPTHGQKEAGNYRKAHVRIRGLEIAIENPAGSERVGHNPDGSIAWSCVMPDHYGYVKKTEGADGDEIDITIGQDHTSELVFVLDQMNVDGTFDEHKVFIWFRNLREAMGSYYGSFSDGSGPSRRGGVTTMDFELFKDWLRNGETTERLRKGLLSLERLMWRRM
jgi:hypothetical protein